MIDVVFAKKLFSMLSGIGFDGIGITRASYGVGENEAHALLARTAEGLGLEVRRDWACNLFMTFPGIDRTRPAVMTGSHIDSVPIGGNYDGAAGVIAGLSVLAGWIGEGFQPTCDVTVIAIRAEESVWFPISYLGSKAAFGMLDEAALAVRRRGDGSSLETAIRKAGGAPLDYATAPVLDPRRIGCFVELHIEQGPVLLETGTILGVVSGICGSRRYRDVVVTGEYAHSGATPRAFRKDAAIATADLMVRLHRSWLDIEAEGGEMTLTFGVCHTDVAQADFSTIAGRVDLSIDIRSCDTDLLARMEANVRATRVVVERDHGVQVELGALTESQPAQMDAALQVGMHDIAAASDIPARTMPSGAGHDAAWFAGRGIPTAMLFVRNANGSHNPNEVMEEADFQTGVEVLSELLRQRSA